MKLSDWAELLLLSALWGGSFLCMRIAAPVLGPVWLIELRVLLAGLALLPLVARARMLQQLKANAKPLFIAGCLNSAIPFVLLAFASVSLPAGFTSILNAMSPLFGAMVAAVWLGERFTRLRLVGFVLGFAGVVALVGIGAVSATPAFFLAVASALGAAMMYAIAAPYIKRNLAGIPALASTTGSQLGAALLLLPALPFTVPGQPMTAAVIGAVLAIAFLCTAFAYILYFRLIQNVGSTKALTVTYLVPLFAMLWGALILDEAITLAMLLGCGLILMGTAISNDLFRVSKR